MTVNKTASKLIDESPLLVLPSLAKAIGLNESILIQQIQFWLANPKAGIEHEGRRWVWNSFSEWGEQFPFWSESTIKRTVKSARPYLIIERIRASDGNQTNFYTLNYAAIQQAIDGVEKPKNNAKPSGGTSVNMTQGTSVNMNHDQCQCDPMDSVNMTQGTSVNMTRCYTENSFTENSSENTHKEQTTAASAFAVCVSDGFKTIWESMPLPRVSKQKAAQAWAKACKGKTPQQVEKGISVIVHDLAERAAHVAGYESPFWKTHLATYINGQMWKDEDMPQRFDKVRGASDSVKGQLNEAQARSRP